MRHLLLPFCVKTFHLMLVRDNEIYNYVLKLTRTKSGNNCKIPWTKNPNGHSCMYRCLITTEEEKSQICEEGGGVNN